MSTAFEDEDRFVSEQGVESVLRAAGRWNGTLIVTMDEVRNGHVVATPARADNGIILSRAEAIRFAYWILRVTARPPETAG